MVVLSTLDITQAVADIDLQTDLSASVIRP